MSFLKRLFGVDDNDNPNDNPDQTERRTQPEPLLDPQLKKPVVAPASEAALVDPHEGPAVAGEDIDNQTLPEDTAEPLARLHGVADTPVDELDPRAPQAEPERRGTFIVEETSSTSQTSSGGVVRGESVAMSVHRRPAQDKQAAQAKQAPQTAQAAAASDSDGVTESDARLVAASMATLENVGITTRAGVEHEDIEDALSDDLELFRRRPLTSLMGSRDPDGELMFEHVFVDDDGQLRCTIDDLLIFLEEAAIAADTDAYISDVVVLDDADDPTKGSMRFRVGEWDVHDVEYDFDPDFGAVDAEAALLDAVAMDGRTAITFEGAYHRHAITIWVDTASAKATDLVSAINTELEH